MGWGVITISNHEYPGNGFKVRIITSDLKIRTVCEDMDNGVVIRFSRPHFDEDDLAAVLVEATLKMERATAIRTVEQVEEFIDWVQEKIDEDVAAVNRNSPPK